MPMKRSAQRWRGRPKLEIRRPKLTTAAAVMENWISAEDRPPAGQSTLRPTSVPRCSPACRPDGQNYVTAGGCSLGARRSIARYPEIVVAAGCRAEERRLRSMAAPTASALVRRAINHAARRTGDPRPRDQHGAQRLRAGLPKSVPRLCPPCRDQIREQAGHWSFFPDGQYTNPMVIRITWAQLSKGSADTSTTTTTGGVPRHSG